MIRAAGVEPRVVEYLETGWDRETLVRLAAGSGRGPAGLLRGKAPAAAALIEAGAEDAAILDAMVADPSLVERPIVETPRGVRLCRPSEAVFALLETPPASFTKEDGQVVTSQGA